MNLENEYPEEVQKYAKEFFDPDFLEFLKDEIIDEQIIFDAICKGTFSSFLYF